MFSHVIGKIQIRANIKKVTGPSDPEHYGSSGSPHKLYDERQLEPIT